MSELQAATAQVVEVPAFVKDAIARTTKARADFAHVQPKDANVGQLWKVKTPIPLWDTIDPEHRLGPVEITVFIAEIPFPTDDDELVEDGDYYGYLCLGASALEDFPVLDSELKNYQHAPYAWWVDVKRPEGSIPATSAEFILPTHPVYVRREWLVACEGNLGGQEAVSRVQNQFWRWLEYNDSPWIDEEHPRNKIGGHNPMNVVDHVRECWRQFKN